MNWKPSRRLVKKALISVPIFLVLYLVSGTLHKNKIKLNGELNSAPGSRKLLEVEEALNCTPLSINDFPGDFFTQEQRLEGGVVIHILICIYLIAILAIVCDEYFVAALESICDRVFITEGDVGVGTIVGSAVFNILAVTSVCGVVAASAIPLEMWPILRDCAAYLVTVLALILVMSDGIVTWYEGLILVILFCLYIILMYFNSSLDTAFSNRVQEWTWTRYTAPGDEEKAPLMKSEYSDEVKKLRSESRDEEFNQSLVESAIIHEQVAQREKEANDENADGHPICSMPHHGVFKQIWWVLMWPASLLLYVTIPDCRYKFWENFFMLTFIMSIVWLGVLSYVIVWMVTIIGFTFGIPDTIMGLTLLAVGTSLPEIVASAIVTREGLGNMAIGNNIGSNVFDILFCLGFPWFLKAAISSESIAIQSGGLIYSSIMLLATIVMFLIALWLTSWRLNKSLGLASGILYVIFLAFAIMYELNVFGPVNLPSCPA